MSEALQTPRMLRIKKLSPSRPVPDDIAELTEDPPLQPPTRKLDEVPLFMRKPLPMNFPDSVSSSTSDTDETIDEILYGTPGDIALKFKERGNQYFKNRQWLQAREAYLDGVEFWPDNAKLMEILWLNVAAANIELGHWPGALRGSAEALTINLKSSKAYYRAARALIHYERYEEALDCCKRTLAYDPSNEAILALMDDPKLGGTSSADDKISTIKAALDQAYKHHKLIIHLNKSVEPVLDIFPYFSPALPHDPIQAPLIFNVTLKYIERNALDVFIGVTTQEPINKLLARCIPGNPSTGWNTGISFDPNAKTEKQVNELKEKLVEVNKGAQRKHPNWDPNYDYVTSNIGIYLETYKQQVVQVLPGHTIAQVFEGIVKSSPDEVEGARLDNGAIILNVFRSSSKAEKLWKEGKGRKGFALTQPKYRKANKQEMLSSGQLRTFVLNAPRDHLHDLSIAARREMLKGPEVQFSEEGK
ncbi:hypothetical protein BDV93DRAFT_72846 [Ceratobasidium sp. AG-I]|nr:hypothetical protein BDV93DRAFT_72846 [Ceratobasidium sp. AG-I]